MTEPNNNNSTITDPYSYTDPLPPTLREGDHFLLHFADNRQIFAQALRWNSHIKGTPSCKINKRTYSTQNLIGLPYGTVLEVTKETLVPLEEGEDLLPCADGVLDVLIKSASSSVVAKPQEDDHVNVTDANAAATAKMDDSKNEETANNDNNGKNNNAKTFRNDNRNLIDDNTSQKLSFNEVQSLMETSTPGSHIVAALISNSASFSSKTVFSQAKYVKRKQMKYQPRCRIVRVTPSTLCSALHLKDARKISNLREDTLGQILSNGNIHAGSKVLVMDTAVLGIISSSITRRMGGYGSVISLYGGQQPGYLDWVVNRMNFTIGEKQSLKWVNLGEVFGSYDEKEKQMKSLMCDDGELNDVEKRDRELISWPAPLQPHTRNYIKNELVDEKKIEEFLTKRSARFTRKLTRHSMLESRDLIDGCRDKEENLDNASIKKDTDDVKQEDETTETTLDETSEESNNNNINSVSGQCDSLIIATKYDPTATLLRLLPYLAPSCPFVIYHEFLEPLLDTFHTLQNYYVPENNDNNNNDEKTNNNGSKTKSPPMMLQRNIAINLRLTDTWFREYQVLEGRTHPNMTMSQNGGYILMGTKLCPKTGTNELDEEALKEIRAKVGGRRRQGKGKDGKGGGWNKRKGDGDKKDDGKRAKM